jgi:hypothetical protein
MDDQLLTKRQWIYTIVIGLVIGIAFNVFMSGKYLDCDWRGGYEPCYLRSIYDDPKPQSQSEPKPQSEPQSEPKPQSQKGNQ